MDLSLFLMTFALFLKSSTCIRCYQCVAELSYRAVEYKCDDFDRSERFIADCQNSSMCYKRVSTLDLGNGMTSKSFHRGCAAQTVNGDQKKINGKWKPVIDIHDDVYDEDCKPDDRDVDRITNTVHCYCRGELCNGSRSITIARFGTALLVITMCLISYNLL